MTVTAVHILGATLLLDLLAITTLVGFERTVPDILELLASSSLAGLLGLLAPSPRQADH